MKLAWQNGFRIKRQGALAFLMLFTAGVPLLAQQAKPADPPVRTIVEREEDEVRQIQKPKGGEGIVVHGHWVVDLKDKDGRVVEHRDFHNSLTPDGAATLIYLLSGTRVPSNFEIKAIGQDAGQTTSGYEYYTLFPSGTNASASMCVPASYGGNYSYCSPSLTQLFNYAGSPSIVLQGQITAPRALSISSLGTNIASCFSQTSGATTTAPASCSTSPTTFVSSLGFTSVNLSTPINMVAGQALSITVTLSFS